LHRGIEPLDETAHQRQVTPLGFLDHSARVAHRWGDRFLHQQRHLLAQPRPHTVHLVFSNGTAADLTLKDQDATKAQFYAIDAKQVKSVEIHVTSVYAPAGASPSSVAITEVEFRVKN